MIVPYQRSKKATTPRQCLRGNRVPLQFLILPHSRMAQGGEVVGRTEDRPGRHIIHDSRTRLIRQASIVVCILSSINKPYMRAPSVMLFLWSLFALLAVGAALPAPSSSEENPHACGDLIREAHDSKPPPTVLHQGSSSYYTMNT
jgi:hypothetical protein